jgi:hypothetical protein
MENKYRIGEAGSKGEIKDTMQNISIQVQAWKVRGQAQQSSRKRVGADSYGGLKESTLPNRNIALGFLRREKS